MHPERTGPRHMDNGVRTVLLRISQGFALFGGLMITVVAFVAVISILGRWLSGLPLISDWFPALSGIAGDVELTEMGVAIAVFAFLPYTQMRYGHVTVDLLVDAAPPRVKAALTVLGNGLFTAVAALLTWRLALGMLEKMGYQETTMILALPLWYGYAPSVVCLGLLALVCAYTTVEAFLDCLSEDPASTRSVRGDHATGGE